MNYPWPIFDPSVLEELDSYTKAHGEEPLSIELKQIFFKRCPEIYQRLKSGAQVQSIQEITFAAHTLKSSAANIGLTRLAKQCEKLEDACRARHDMTNMLQLIEELEEMVGASFEALHTYPSPDFNTAALH